MRARCWRVQQAELYAVASPTPGNAERFAQQFGNRTPLHRLQADARSGGD